MVSGKFDILHEGHLDHLKKAYCLGDYLIILTHPDDRVKNCHIPLWARVEMLQGYLKFLGGKGEVIVDTLDMDGTCVKAIQLLKPDIFAKGGDRVPDNMPQSEIDVCEKIGCKIVYGIGDLLNSSSKIKRSIDND